MRGVAWHGVARRSANPPLHPNPVRLQEKHWDDLANTVPPLTVRGWRALEKGMEKYVALLKSRGEMIEEVSGLHQQNMELKALLTQYLGDKVRRPRPPAGCSAWRLNAARPPRPHPPALPAGQR